jgi:hypothetical protein
MTALRLRDHKRALAIYLVICAVIAGVSGAPLGYALRALGAGDPRGQIELFGPGLEALAMRVGEASAASVFAVASASLGGLLLAVSIRSIARCIWIDHVCALHAAQLSQTRARRLLRALWLHALVATLQLVVFGSAMLGAGRLFVAGDVARDLARAGAAIVGLGVAALLAMLRDVALVRPYVAHEPQTHWAMRVLRRAPRLLWAKAWRTLLGAVIFAAAAWSTSMLASVTSIAFFIGYVGTHLLLATHTALELSYVTAAVRIVGLAHTVTTTAKR